MYTVSIIIPCFNQGHFLPEALDSVLAQTYTNWECIIVNDGSTDNTEEIGHNYCKLDDRFRYVKKENGGLSSARNAGLQIATGDYLQLLDADDLLYPNKLKSQLEFIRLNGFSLVASNYDNLYGSDFKINSFSTGDYSNFLRDIILNWESAMSVPCHCFLFSRSITTKLKFNEDLPNHEDWHFWVLAVSSVDGRVGYVPEVLCTYRRSENLMSSNLPLMIKGFKQAAKMIFSEFSWITAPYLKLLILKKYFSIQFLYNTTYFARIINRFKKYLQRLGSKARRLLPLS